MPFAHTHPLAAGPAARPRLAAALAEVSRADGATAVQRAVTHAAEIVRADRCALITANAVAHAHGFGAPRAPHAALLHAARGPTTGPVALPGHGAHELYAAAVDADPASWLVVARPAPAFDDGERDAVTAIARVLSMTLTLRRAEGELAHQALHDRLTGLPNRDLMRDRAKRVLRRAAGYGDRLVAAMVIDLDHFKLANESLDHEHGDRLLVLVAERLKAVLDAFEDARRSVALGRYGGDEFLVLCERLAGEHDTIVIAERVREAVAQPFLVDGREIALTASVGIAFAGLDAPLEADAFLSHADVALARAKELGRDRYEIFDEGMRARLLDRALLHAELRDGLQRAELRLHFQPVVTVADSELASVEALVRWQHPLRGLLGPGEFIALAEQTDLIVDVGDWVIAEACAQIRRWREAHPARLAVRVSVNVSARQLSPALVETVAGALRANDVDPSLLALEITESVLVGQRESARELLAALRAIGVAIVLDDFGTGYSSLSYLKEFPLDQLKLDRSFCTELDDDLRSAKIVAATIEMARALGMTVVAEGVETEEQLTVLRRLGCDFAQGFWFAEPRDGDAIFTRVREAYERDSRLAAVPAPDAVVERRDEDDRRRGGGRRAEDRRAAAGNGSAAAEIRRPAGADPRPELARLAAEALPAPPVAPRAVHALHQRSLGRMAGLLFIVGGVLAIPADFVMGAPSPLAVVVLSLMAVLTGVACLLIPWDRISPRWLHVVATLATIEVTVSVVSVGRHGTALIPFYLLVAVAIAYGFRDRRVIAAQGAGIVVAMLVPPLVLSDQPMDALPRAMVAALVLVVTAAVVVYLRERLESSAAELRVLVDRDPLTDVGNYRLLHKRLAYELHRHEREQRDLAVLLIDLDRFKQVNERLGHAAGDDVLRRVARTLRDAVRAQDTVARQGGDEFAVLAPGTDTDGAAMLAGRLRQRLRRLRFAGEAIDATIGWAVFPGDGDSAQALLAHADAQLLGGKHGPARAAMPASGD